MPKIAISYRRKDSDAITGRIRDRLAQHFGERSVFMDIDNIPLGIDYRQQIQKALQEADVLLVIMGPIWSGPIEGGSARIYDPADPVRVEVEAALRHGIPTIPVLVGGAAMPGATDLPESLDSLRYRNAAEVDAGLDFNPHIERLIRAIEQIKSGSAAAAGQPRRPNNRTLVTAVATLAVALLIGLTFAYFQRGTRTGPDLASNSPPPAAAPTSAPAPASAPEPTPAPTPAAPVPAAAPAPASGPAPTEIATAPPQPEPAKTDSAADTKSAAAAATACEPGSVPAFFDSFKTVDPAWQDLGTDPKNGFYVGGGHAVVAPPANDDLAFLRRAIFRNGSICLTIISPATMKDASATSAGLLFWDKGDDKNFYNAGISPAGSYWIYKYVNDKKTVIAEDKTDAIKTGPKSENILKLTNRNGKNTFYINGRKLKEFDGQPGAGDDFIGLGADSETAQSDEWRFSQIVMTQPNYADEFTDFGVLPQAALKEDVGTKTPMTAPGARLISTSDLYAAIQRGSLDGAQFLLVDVLADTHPKTIRGAKRLPDGGSSGHFDDDVQQRLRTQLMSLTKNNLAMPIVFFCEGAACWESYNAVLRAVKMGFSRVFWYRGGLNSWKQANFPMG
jgi:PQQ-dependent catabolism-associated CXXCW motif protein